MNVTAFDRTTPGALHAALTRRGLDPVRADAVVQGVRPVAFMIDGLDDGTRERVTQAAHRQRVECLTGNGWAVLAGGAAEVAGFARVEHTLLPNDLAARLGSALGASWVQAHEWPMGRGTVAMDEPVIVGILNVTPDSFSDGGRYLDPRDASDQVDRLVQDGAAMLDVGAESTGPGRPEPVTGEEEWRRLAPVLAGIRARHPDLPFSVDTMKAETARRALEAGAWAINDVSGLRHDPQLATVCAEFDAGLVLMHSRGSASTMATYDHAVYDDVVCETVEELGIAQHRAEARGVAHTRIVLDPGLGFSKTAEHSVTVLQAVGAVLALGSPVMIGPSRKRFLGALTQREADDRDVATAAACVAGLALGARLFRVHAPGPVRDALAVGRAVWNR